jgi:hypothetical protein
MHAGRSTSCTTSSPACRRFRILNVIDDITKERLAAFADTCEIKPRTDVVAIFEAAIPRWSGRSSQRNDEWPFSAPATSPWKQSLA